LSEARIIASSLAKDDKYMDVTRLLEQWRSGDNQARSAVLEFVYPYLRKLANQQMRGKSWTLSATEFANEAAIQIAGVNQVQWVDRQHLMAIAAKVLRRVIVDHQRARMSQKRNSGATPVELTQVLGLEPIVALDEHENWIDIDRALSELESLDSVAAGIAELKIFSGMNGEEIAATAGMSLSSMWRQWSFARVWLIDRLSLYVNSSN
jgi:RNA polymerase sigma factor (TIGR02999 family)